MNSDTEDKIRNKFGYAAWIGIGLVTAFAFLGAYYFKFSGPVQAIMWIGWFIVALLFFYFTEQGKRAFLFALEAKLEMQKVVWPARSETVQTTTIVMIMVAVTGFVLWAIDLGMMLAIGKITHLG